jgi:tRNA-specific 2-thiouridylase
LLRTRWLILRDVNWLGDRPLDEVIARSAEAVELHVKVRSTQPPRPARLATRAGRTAVELTDPEYGVAAGQACVFYADGGSTARVLGGGFIASVEREALAGRANACEAHASQAQL